MTGCAQSGSLFAVIRRLFERRPATPPQRRRHVRVATDEFEVTCWVGRERRMGVVKDVSASGLRLHLGRPVHLGDTVTVRLDERHRAEIATVRARVSWTASRIGRFEVGLKFLDRRDVVERSWVQPMLEQAGYVRDSADDRRRSRRIPTRMRAFVRGYAAATRNSATIVDLGDGGALLHTGRAIEPGVFVRLSSERVGLCEGFDVEARVLRVRPYRDGSFRVNLEFVSPCAQVQRHLERLTGLAA